MKKTKLTNFCLLFQHFRETFGLNHEALSKYMGYSSLYLLYIEMGRRKPDRDLVEAMIKVYGLEAKGKRVLYDAASEATGSLPYDVLDYLEAHPEKLEEIKREIMLEETMNKTK